ncbi:uncharacterized protein TNCV_893541 [Trichonephila clavipes]|nr:uncharacterized protein TNCV_893541 [Trichonephila clavipes]
MINFYRRYLKDAAKTQAPLHELLKGAKRKTAEKCIGLMTPGEASKNAKLTLPMLFYHFQDLDYPYHFAQMHFCCGRSTQIRKRALETNIFYSKKLTETQTRYSTYDRELLGIYLSVNFKHLLEGNDFVIYTDHKPLTFAFKQKNEKASPRQQRQLYISEFSCNIQHVLGKDNVVADALSRIHSISKSTLRKLQKKQTTDEELQILLHNNSLKFKPSTLPSGKKLWCDISTQKIRLTFHKNSGFKYSN